MKVFELKKRKNLSHAIHAIALVENPAIEEDFIYLSIEGKKQESNIYLSEEKGIIYSPVLIPDQRIKRLSDSGETYEIFFSAETIEEAAYDMMKAKSLDNFNEEHSDKKINNTNVVELWVVEDPEKDKASALGFNVVKGTLMAGIKVDNEEARANIKAGKIKGISIEGLFEDFELVEENNEQVKLKSISMNDVKQLAKDLMTKLSEIAGPTKLAAEKTDKGIIYTPDEFVEGEMIFSDQAMQTPAEDGEYISGEVKYVVSGGRLAARESVQSNEPAEEEAVSKIQMAAAEAVIALSEKVEKLSSELAEATKANNDLTTKLSEVEKEVGEHKTLLSKVKESAPESVTKLSSDSTPSKVDSYLSTRKTF